jgi:hypothetical protein
MTTLLAATRPPTTTITPAFANGGALLPWSTAQRPATARDERRFVEELRRRAGSPAAEHRRGDLTVVLNALRGGLAVDDLLDMAPGAVPGRLLAAYHDLDARRSASVEAWGEIVADPSLRALERHAPVAAALAPILVDRVRSAALIGTDALADVVERFDARVVEQRLAVWRLELVLDKSSRTDADAISIGQLLYDGSPDCLAARDDFLADRVGLLSPTRVTALLRLPRPGR